MEQYTTTNGGRKLSASPFYETPFQNNSLLNHRFNTTEITSSDDNTPIISEYENLDAITVGTNSPAIVLCRNSRSYTTGPRSPAVSLDKHTRIITEGISSNGVAFESFSLVKTKERDAHGIALAQRSKVITDGLMAHAIAMDIKSETRTHGENSISANLGYGGKGMVSHETGCLLLTYIDENNRIRVKTFYAGEDCEVGVMYCLDECGKLKRLEHPSEFMEDKTEEPSSHKAGLVFDSTNGYSRSVDGNKTKMNLVIRNRSIM